MESMADADAKRFSESLVSGVDNMLGLRMGEIRRIAKEAAAGDWRAFASDPGDVYFEETMARGLAIAYAKVPFREKVDCLERFVSTITDWMVCDSLCATIKPTEGDADEIWNFSVRHLSKDGEFEKRFGAVMLMRFIDGGNVEEIMGLIASTDHPGYYWKMGAAWALAECCVKCPEAGYGFLSDNEIDREVLSRTVRKIRESWRPSEEWKDAFRKLVRSESDA